MNIKDGDFVGSWGLTQSHLKTQPYSVDDVFEPQPQTGVLLSHGTHAHTQSPCSHRIYACPCV